MYTIFTKYNTKYSYDKPSDMQPLHKGHEIYIDNVFYTQYIILPVNEYKYFYQVYNIIRDLNMFNNLEIYNRALNFIEIYLRNQKILSILA